jgi:IclR family acetate operon transcriptional repressor
MQPVVRALRLLTALAKERSALTLQELADLQDLPVSTVHRLVGVLQAEGYLIRSNHGKLYSLGPAVRSLVSSTSSDLIRRVAEPVMRRLNAATHETVILGEMIGEDAICFATQEGRRALRMYVQPGSELPLHAAATGRILLSGFDDETARSLLEAHAPLERWTKNTKTDIDEVIGHLDTVRARGYDVCEDEMQNSTWAVAAPLIDASGSIRASLGLVAPMQAVRDQEQSVAFTQGIVEAAREISEELGAPSPAA